jgi:hypothetical protein
VTTKLHVSGELAFPIDFVTSTTVVYGAKGMGKTNLGSVLAEELAAAGLRFSILDPVGVWWGLRHALDGKRPGIEILILGGIHGDIPIEPTGGAVVADLVVDEHVNVLIDISRHSNGSMWSIGERIRFVTDYCKRLYQRQGERRRPIMQFIDEAARFIPQMVRKNEDNVALCMGAIAVLVEEGRNVGIGVTLLTLRSARLNKDVAELADCMIAFRTVGPNSIGAVLDWLGEHVELVRVRELGAVVRKLPVGSALVVSPGWLDFEGVVPFRARRTFDSSKTPKPGQEVRASGPGAKPDLTKYQTLMAETIERQKENDPKALKKTILELERQLAAAVKGASTATTTKPQPAAKFDAEKLHSMANKAADRAVAKAFRPLNATTRKIANDFSSVKGLFATIETSFLALIDQAKEIEGAGVDVELIAAPSIPPARAAVREPTPPRTPAPRTSGDAGRAGVQQRILNALAELEQLGARRPPRELVAMLAGYSNLASKGFRNATSTLRTEGLIDYPDADSVIFTDAGRAQAEFPAAPRSATDVQQRIIALLGGASGRILRPLIDAYPKSLPREQVAAAAGYGNLASKGFRNSVSRLRTLGFVDYPDRDSVVAKPVLFLEGA